MSLNANLKGRVALIVFISIVTVGREHLKESIQQKMTTTVQVKTDKPRTEQITTEAPVEHHSQEVQDPALGEMFIYQYESSQVQMLINQQGSITAMQNMKIYQ